MQEGIVRLRYAWKDRQVGEDTDLDQFRYTNWLTHGRLTEKKM